MFYILFGVMVMWVCYLCENLSDCIHIICVFSCIYNYFYLIFKRLLKNYLCLLDVCMHICYYGAIKTSAKSSYLFVFHISS